MTMWPMRMVDGWWARKQLSARGPLRLAWSAFAGLLLLLVVTFGFGCTTEPIKMRASVREGLASEPVIHVAVRKPPMFKVLNANEVMFGDGVVGLLVAMNSSTGDVQRSGNWDPTVVVRSEFIDGLQRDLGLGNLRVREEPVSGEEIPPLKETFNSGLVIDLRSNGWWLVYFPFDHSRYRMGLHTEGRLVQFPEGKILWRQHCVYVGNDPDTAPTLAELNADQGVRLRSMTEEVARAGAKLLVDKLMGREL